MTSLFQTKKKGGFLTDAERARIEDIIHLRAVRFGALHPHGFSYQDIEKRYSKLPKDWEVVKTFLNDAWDNYHGNYHRPTPFQYFGKIEGMNGNADKSIYILNYEASFNFLDYMELIETRENARNAHFYAVIAIGLNVITLGLTVNWNKVWNFLKPYIPC